MQPLTRNHSLAISAEVAFVSGVLEDLPWVFVIGSITVYGLE